MRGNWSSIYYFSLPLINFLGAVSVYVYIHMYAFVQCMECVREAPIGVQRLCERDATRGVPHAPLRWPFRLPTPKGLNSHQAKNRGCEKEKNRDSNEGACSNGILEVQFMCTTKNHFASFINNRNVNNELKVIKEWRLLKILASTAALFLARDLDGIRAR